jgi:beta-mannanase
MTSFLIRRGLLLLSVAAVAGCAVIFILHRHGCFWRDEAVVPDMFDDRSSEPVLALLDQNKNESTLSAKAVNHYTLQLNNSGDLTFQDKLASTISSNQAVLLTVEMWVQSDSHRFHYGTLEATFKGKHDKKIKELCSLLSKSPRPVFLRWNPEMEMPSGLYPWQNRNTDVYIKAFRHFARLCKESAPEVKIVWGPTGFPGDLEYWPGTDLVDVASVTLGSRSEECSAYRYPQGKTATEIIRSKLHRLRFIDKPIIILGADKMTKAGFQKEWLQTAIADLRSHGERITRSRMALASNTMDTATGAVIKTRRDPDSKPLLGVYDPFHRLVNEGPISLEHLFAHLTSLKDGTFENEFNGVVARGHDLLITLEFWKGEEDADVLRNTLNGRYDATIKEMTRIMSRTKQDIYLRWAHEMEIPIERYPWQSKDPTVYIEAFRYFASRIRQGARNVYIVWAPAGDRAALDFWPGDDVVDAIGLAIYGLPTKNISDYTMQDSFRTILVRKLRTVGFVEKPIFLAEIGVEGPEVYQERWLKEAAKTIDDYPEILLASYFNMPDSPKAWGEIEAPDWSISKATFKTFVESLQGAQKKEILSRTRRQ